MNQLETAVFQMYADLNMGQNVACRQCIAAERALGDCLGRPVSFWHIGDKFTQDQYRILFVGKNAYDCSDLRLIDGCYHDASRRGAELYHERFSDFWTYTEEIICQLFQARPEEALRRIAVTNMVKCNHSSGKNRSDTTTESLKRYCADTLGVVWREIAIIKPKAIVFYTHDAYDEQIARFRIGDRYEDITARSQIVPVGQKTILWWHRRFFHENERVLDFLRTSHPERKKKDEYVTAIVSWLSKTQG